jgi:hypothetical protein
VDEDQDVGAAVAAAHADVVEAAVVAQGELAVGVDAVVADAIGAGMQWGTPKPISAARVGGRVFCWNGPPLLAPVAARAAEVTQIAGESWQTTTALTRTTTPRMNFQDVPNVV